MKGSLANKTGRLLLLLLITGATSPAHAGLYSYQAPPEPSEHFTLARFKLYVPDSLPVIRGVLFVIDPEYHDSGFVVHDPAYRKLCEDTGFALMGAILSDMTMNTGIGNAVLRSLHAFSAISEHPEIEFAAVFLNGWSWGGQFAYHFARWNPQRTIGFITQKGGLHDTSSLAGEATDVPGYMFIGAGDRRQNRRNLTWIFEKYRPLGAPWILAVQPDKAHARITDMDLIGSYFRDVVQLRLPQAIPIDNPVKLRRVEESLGWLGNRDPSSFKIGAFACYGADVGQASWFPSQDSAEKWQAFVSLRTATDAFHCPSTHVELEAHVSVSRPTVSQNYPNPFNPATTVIFEVPKAGRVEFRILNVSGQLVRTLVDEHWEMGQYSIRWDGTDRHGIAVASGVYICYLGLGGSVSFRKMTLVR